MPSCKYTFTYKFHIENGNIGIIRYVCFNFLDYLFEFFFFLAEIRISLNKLFIKIDRGILSNVWESNKYIKIIDIS